MTEREQTKQAIKRQLHSYRELETERLQLLDELQRLEVLMDAPCGSNWDGMPHGTDISNPVANMVAKKVTLENHYRTKLTETIVAQAAIEALIMGLDPIERCLARLRYIEGLQWESVCYRMNYSWRQVHRIHGRLLDKLVDAEMARREA